jgi:hypothetical protein
MESENDTRAVARNDRGKLWLIQRSGGKADLYRDRSQRQRDWLRMAIDEGWLTATGYLTAEGKALALSFDVEEHLA